MSVTAIFNAAIAIVEDRRPAAEDILFGCGFELGSIRSLVARLEQAVNDRLIADAAHMLSNLLIEEMAQPIPDVKDMSMHDLAVYIRGRADALKIFEDNLEDLRNQTKPNPEYEPVDLPEKPVDRIVG